MFRVMRARHAGDSARIQCLSGSQNAKKSLPETRLFPFEPLRVRVEPPIHLMPTQVQQPPPPPDVHHDAHSKHAHANALHRDALSQALGSILSPKRPTMTARSSSVDSSRSSSGTASPAHGHPAFPPPPAHPHPHAHSHSPLADSPVVVAPTDAADADTDAEHDVSPAPPPNTPIAPMALTPTPAARARIIDYIKSKNGAWDALIHGSFS
ncbi:hypothetical protein GGX14DRAFT_480902 [Mycena pura]|uniref:Uncharacterized protein n=1 Tax=Mycena pura TaxID=153505 RepID=A0AAD6UPE9_9AGAR|nr:hypothetical protein GGX14DRAFT_480902 [Mycena pura]